MDILYTILYKSLQDNLPMREFQFVRVSTMAQALGVLGEDWDIILMDYHLGTQETEKGGAQFYNGADLVTYRRNLEGASPERKRAQIIGTAGTMEFCEKLEAAGSDLSCTGDAPLKRCIIKHLQAWLPGER